MAGVTARTSASSSDALRALVEQGRAAERANAWDRALAYYEAAFRRVAVEGTCEQVAELLWRIGLVRRERGELELARELYEASLEVAELNDLMEHVAAALSLLATLEQCAGRLDVAEQLYARAKRLAGDTGDEHLVALIDQKVAELAALRGDVPAALYAYTSALMRWRRLGDDRSAVGALNSMGLAHAELGELDAATLCLDEAYELASSAKDALALAYVQANRAELFLRRQQFEQARQCCDEGLALFAQLDSKTGLAEVYRCYGVLYRETGKAHLADVHLGRAWALARDARNGLLQADVQHELARLHFEQAREREAIHCLNRAYTTLNALRTQHDATEVERQLDALECTYVRVVRRWGADAIDAQDPYTIGHAERVADLACALGETIGLDGRELTWLRIGALLHDVGKTVVPASVLVKPGVLDEHEWVLMKQHTTVGDEIVAELELPYDVRPMVRSHHERWDGQGYPDRLTGEAIPLLVRILSVADVYDALTSRRSYRNAFSSPEARRILDHQAGSAFDPVLVSQFRALVGG
jgi:putative nucleotidyltransferase with HDIG domain